MDESVAHPRTGHRSWEIILHAPLTKEPFHATSERRETARPADRDLDANGPSGTARAGTFPRAAGLPAAGRSGWRGRLRHERRGNIAVGGGAQKDTGSGD